MRRRSLIALLTVPLAAVAGCGADEPTSPGSPTTITVGVIPIVDVAPLYLGIKQGFFTAEGLDVKLETATGGAAIVPAVLNQQYQFGFSNTVSILVSASKNFPVKVVAAGVATTGVDGKDFGAVFVKADSPIKSAADLAGKRIAVNTLKNINTATVANVVRKAGGDPSGITFVELPFPEIAPAIAKGDVDAGQVVEPFLTIATGQGLRQVVSNYAATDPNLIIGMYLTSQEYAAQNPERVKGFTTAMTKSLEYAAAHPDEVRAILSTYTKIEAAVQQGLVLPKWPTSVDRAPVQLLADLAKTDGLITDAPDLDKILP